MFALILGFFAEVFTLIGYGAWRALRSDGWDDSNLLNWLRLLSMVFIHPEWFGKMYYLTGNDWYVVNGNGERLPDANYRPFGFISKDEFDENFPETKPE